MTFSNETSPHHEAGARSASEDDDLTITCNYPDTTRTAPSPHLSARDARQRLTDCYAVIVAGKAVRKHLYFNLPAAQRAAERARARGAEAHLILVRLVPVDHRQLDQLEAVIAGE